MKHIRKSNIHAACKAVLNRFPTIPLDLPTAIMGVHELLETSPDQMDWVTWEARQFFLTGKPFTVLVCWKGKEPRID